MTELELKRGAGDGHVGQVALALEQMLAASDLILELLPVALCIYDLDGHIIRYNRRAVEIWGREPVAGMTRAQFTAAAKFFWPDGRPLRRNETPLALVLETGQPVRHREMMVERPDGVR